MNFSTLSKASAHLGYGLHAITFVSVPEADNLQSITLSLSKCQGIGGEWRMAQIREQVRKGAQVLNQYPDG